MIHSSISSKVAKQLELVEVLASTRPNRNRLVKNLVGLLVIDRELRHEREKRIWNWK